MEKEEKRRREEEVEVQFFLLRSIDHSILLSLALYLPLLLFIRSHLARMAQARIDDGIERS